MLQRIRTLVSEEQKRSSKYPLRKQGSKSMGEKIAHPDYADPQKLFSNSCSSSRVNLNVELSECELPAEPERLDMTISEKEVLNEFEKRLNNSTNRVPDTGQMESDKSVQEKIENSVNSSQNSDSYYESILEKSLIEEYTKDENGRLIAKQDSFKSNENSFYIHKYRENDVKALKDINGGSQISAMKRPIKAPPPIPTKPTRLSVTTRNISNVLSTETIKSTTINCKQSYIEQNNKNENEERQDVCEKSWVKTMVGRFE